MPKKRESLYQKKGNGMILSQIEALTTNQQLTFDFWDDDKNMVLHGHAGTGKTFLAMYLALEALEDRDLPYRKIMIVRSAVPSRDMGFLPGNQDEKSAAYEEPYESIVNTLYGRGDAYEICKKNGSIDFRTTSYLRGVTYDRTIIIIDEVQNFSWEEINTILTRVGEDTKFIMCGDLFQCDLKKEKPGLKKAFDILRQLSEVRFIEFNTEDIVRSGFVKEYIIALTEYENDDGKIKKMQFLKENA